MDLNSLVSSFNSLSEEIFKELLDFFDFHLRKDEIEQVSLFIDNLDIEDKYFGYFYLGYKIPQIDKEFDLLRFGENYILNVEIKSILKVDDAKEQLIMNRYYLASLGKKIKSFTYVAEDNTLYQLDDDQNFQQIQFDVFEKILTSQKLEHHSNLDELFEPSDYLVSPFNDSKRFISGSYFLTKQQQEFKEAIVNSCAKFTIIDGLPGTGKTLLLYDLAKEFIEDYNTVIIHTGTLNIGHLKLKQQYQWNIIPIKDFKGIENLKPDFIFVDETQRMRPYQLNYLIKYVNENDIFCIFSIDPKQILSLQEWNYDNKKTLMTLEGIEEYKLSKKIRTNKELAAFIKGLFNLNYMHYCNNTDNMSIHYFNDISKARGFAEGMETEGWQVIDYTGENWNGQLIEKMRLHRGLNAHGVLGQEFDKVLVLVGSTFYYGESGRLAVRGKNHYDPERMFYQSVTRARKQIMLLIVNNSEFMARVIKAVNKKNN